MRREYGILSGEGARKRPRRRRSERDFRSLSCAVFSIVCVILLVSGLLLFSPATDPGTLTSACERGECDNHPKFRAQERKERAGPGPAPPAASQPTPGLAKTEFSLPPLAESTLYQSACMPVIRGDERPALETAGQRFEQLLTSLTRPPALTHAPALRSLYEQCARPAEDQPASQTFSALLTSTLQFDYGDRLEDLLGAFARFDIANPLALSFELHPKHGLRAGRLVPLISQHEVRFSHEDIPLDQEALRAYKHALGCPETAAEKSRMGDFVHLYAELHMLRPTHNAGVKMIDYALHSPALREEMLAGPAEINEFADALRREGFDLRRYFAAARVAWPEEALWVHSPHTMLDFARLAHSTPPTAWRDYLYAVLRSLTDPELQRKATPGQHYVYHTHYSGRWALPWDVPSQYEFVTTEDHCMGLVEAYLPHATNLAVERAIPNFRAAADRVRALFAEAKEAVLAFVREDRDGLFGRVPPQLLQKLERTQLVLFDEADEIRANTGIAPEDIEHTQHYLDTILELRRRSLQRAATLRWNPNMPDARLLYDQLATPENAYFVHQLNAVVFNLGLVHAFATGVVRDEQLRFLLAHELAHSMDATGLFYDDRGGLTLELVLDPAVQSAHRRWIVELEKHYTRASFVHRVDNDVLRSEHENFADAVATLSLVRANPVGAKRVSEMLHSVARLFCKPLPYDRQEDVRFTFSSTHSLPSVRTDALWSLASKDFSATPPQPRYS